MYFHYYDVDYISFNCVNTSQINGMTMGGLSKENLRILELSQRCVGIVNCDLYMPRGLILSSTLPCQAVNIPIQNVANKEYLHSINIEYSCH